MFLPRYFLLSVFLLNSADFAFDSEDTSSHLTKGQTRLNNLPSNLIARVLEYTKPKDMLRLEESGDIVLRGKLCPTEMNVAWKLQYLNRKNRKAHDFSSDVNSWKDLYKFVSTLWCSAAFLDWHEDQIIEEMTKIIPAGTPLHFHLRALTTKSDKESRVLFESASGISVKELVENPDKVLTHLRYFKPSINYILRDLWKNKERYADEKIYQALLVLGEQGIEEAQGYVSRALYVGSLGLRSRDKKDRFVELMAHAKKGWQHAQSVIAKAIFEERLIYKGITIEVKYEELLKLSAMGSIDGHHYLAALIEENWSEIPALKHSAFSSLEDLASKGSRVAERAIVDSLYLGENLFGRPMQTKDQRFETLLKYATKGNFYAKDPVKKSLESS